MADWWEKYKKDRNLGGNKKSPSERIGLKKEVRVTDENRQTAKSSTWWEDYKKKRDLNSKIASDRQRTERSQRFASASRQLEENRSRDAAEDEIRELWRNPFSSDAEWQAGVLQRNAERYKRDLPLYQQAMQNASTWGEYFSTHRQAGESQSAVKHQFERYQQAAQNAEQERNESNLVNRPAQWQAENLSPQEIEQRLAYYRSEAATPTVTDRDREERAYLYPEAALQKDPHGARFDERLVEDAGQDAIDAAYRPILTEQEKAAVEEADQQIIKEKAERNYEQVQRLLAAQAGQTEMFSRARGNELIEEIAQGGEAAKQVESGRAAFEAKQQQIASETSFEIGDDLDSNRGAYNKMQKERRERGYILGYDWDNVPEARKQAVYALYAQDPEKAMELAKYYIADARQAEDEEKQAWYAQNGWTAAMGLVSSAAAHLGAAVDPFGDVGQELTRRGDNALAGGSQWADAATGYQKIPEWVPVVGGKGAGDLYQTVGSVVQSAAVAAPAILAGRYDQAGAEVLSKLGLALMGSSAAASDYRESVAAGMDEDRAKLHALAAGVEEALFEEVSLDKLIKMDTSGGLKAALKNWLVQSGIEGSEELATSIANRITDEMISGAGQSKVERRASELIANGMSSTEAHNQAESEWMTDTLYDGFSGFLSGGMMTGGNYALQGAANLTERAVNAAETRKAQKQAGAAVSRSEGSVEALQAYAKDNGIEIKAVETADQNAGESAEQGSQAAKQNSYSSRDYRSISDTTSKVTQSIRNDLRGKTVQEQQAVRDSLVEKYGDGIAPVVNNAISIETAARVRQEYGDVDSIQAARNKAVSEIKDESLRRAVSDGYDSAAYSLAASQGGEGGMNAMSRYIQQRRNTGSGSEMSMNATVTAQDGSTKAIAITGMSEDGKRVSLADGSEIAVKDLQADADTTSAIQQLADLDLGADATKVLQAYQQSGISGTEGYRWLMDYATAYNQGRTRQISLEQAAQRSSLDERTVMDAYTLGQQAANRETQAGLEKLKNLPKRKGANGRTANIDTTEIKGKTMSKSELEQFELANQYAQALGVDMKWFSSKEKDGKFVGKNGAYENGKIYMDIHAGRNFAADLTSGILATMGHELTHFQQQYAPEEYQALKQFLFEQIVKSSPNGEARLERLIWEKQRRSGYTLSRKAAEDEVVADACQKMLRDSKAVHDFTSQQPEAANGVVRWLDKWFKRVRSIFGRGGNYSEEAQLMDSLEQDVKAAFGELWDKALKQATKVHDEVGNIEKSATEKAQNSDREDQSLRGLVSELEDQLDMAELNGLSQSEIRKLNNELIKARGQLDNYTTNQRRQAKKTSFNEILRNLENYERVDLESLAEQISDSAWDDYDELSDEELIDALRETINERLDDFAPGDADNPKYGLFVKKPKTAGNISVVRNSDRDTEYLELAEDPEKNKARLQEMVYEAAKRAGFTSPMLFHGTNAFGFTTIKTSKDVHADGFSFWAANKESAAGTYTRYGKTREIESEIGYEETEEAIEERSADVDEAIDDFRYLIDRTFSEWFYGQQGNEVIRRGVDDSNPDPGSGDGVYDFLVDQVADAFNEYSDSLSETYEDFADFQERSKEWEKIEDAIVAIEGAYSALSEIQSDGLVGGIYELYANTDNMYVVDAKGAAWNALHPEGLPKIERGEYKNIPYKTRDVANWARDNGYDGVIFKNIKDNGAYGRTESFDVYAFFNPQAQVKSADPVTYDDQGNVIPLSERFNTKNQDIRYSERDYSTPSDEELLMGARVEDAESAEARAALQNSQKQARQIRDLTRRLEHLQTEIRGYEGDSPNRISVQRFTRQALDLFGIPSGMRTDMGELLQSVAEGVLAGHNLSQNDIMYFFETLITNGREKTVADETLAEIRDDLKGRKIYVNENVKAEFGDDWNAFRKRAFSLGIQLTNNEKNMGIDSVNAELAELYPGKFDADETDLRSILENIVDTAESGKTSDVPILDAMREIQKQTGEPVREQLQTMLDQFTRQIEIMQDQAAVERKARAGNAAEIAKARKQINEAKEALREVRKQRDAWKRKSEGADARQKRALDAALRGVVQHDAKQIAEAVRQKQALAKKLQDQINREKKILSGELRAPELVKMLKAEREKAEARVKKQKEQVFQNYKERKKAGELRGRIKNLSDEMKRRMTNPTDRAYVPASLYQSMTKLADVLDNVLSPNPGTKAEARYRAMMDAIRGMAREYEDVKNLDPVFASEYEQEISDAIGEIERILERKNASWIDGLTGDTQKGLAELNSDELQQLYDLMRQINYTITNATKVFGNSNYKSIFDAQRAVAEQQNSMKSLNAVSSLERKKRLRLLNSLSVMRATEMMAGWDRSAALYQLMHGIEQGADDAWAWVMDYNKSMQDLKTGKNEKEYRQALTKQLDFGITDRDGLKVTMTKMQALQILMTAEREEHNDKLLHLQAGGAVIRNATDLQNGKGAKARSQTISVTPELIQKISDSLTEWDRAYMKTVRDYFKREGKQTNEILYKLKHKVLKTEEFYVPYTVDRNYLEANLNEQQALNMWVKTPGSTNAIKQKAKQPVIIDGMDTVMGQHVKEIGNYIGMAIPIRDFSKVYNGMIPTEGPNPLPVKETIERTFGKAGQHLLTQAVIDVQGGTARQNWESNIAQFLNKLQGAFVKSALLINPSVTIKQAASYIAAESVISHLALERGNHPVWARTDESKSFMPGGLIAQLFARPEGKTAQRIYNEIDQHTSLHYQRRQGMSMAEIAEQANRTGPIKRRINAIGASMEQSKIGRAVRRTGENLNPLAWIQRMDVATTAALWVACKEQAKLDKLTVGSEEFWKRTTELYERCIRETQPMYDGLHRTANQKQAGGLMQYLFPFRTVPIQNHGQLAASYEAYKAARESKNEAKIKEAGKFFRKTVWAQTESAFVFSVMTFLAAILKRKTKKYRDEEGELDAGSFTKGLLTDVGSTLISVLNPMYGSELFNLGSRAVDKFEGNSGYTYDAFSVGVVDMINDLASSGDRLLADAGKIVRGENVNAADFWNHAMNLLVKGGKLAGIPADTVKTYFEGTKGNIQDAIEGRIPALNDESWERDAATNARRYLKAYLNNDTQKASAVLAELRSNLSRSGKDEEKINEAIRKAVSAQAIEKVADGTWTEEEAEAYLLSTGAYDDRENPQKDAWNAIRKGVAKSTSTGEEFNWKQYDDLAEAVANGEDVTGLLTEYRNHGYSDDQINAAIRSGIQEALTAGDLDGNEAADALIRYGVTYSKDGKAVAYDEQTAWKKVQEWADKAEHTDEEGELEEGYKYSAYADLFDAVDTNQNADGIIQTMVQNGGYDTDSLRSQIKDHLLERFISGEITETALKNQLARYCKITKTEDANEIVKSAKCKRDFGVSPDGLKEAFKDGDLSQNQAEKALQQYKGLSKADAQNRVQYWGYDGDLSESAWLKWNNELKSSGLSVENWEKVSKVKSDAKGTDANGDGRADSGTVKAEVVSYIDSMNIPKSQKKAIYLAFGWAASTMPNWR